MKLSTKKSISQNRFGQLLIFFSCLLLVFGYWDSLELGLFRIQRLLVDIPNEGILVLEYSSGTQNQLILINSNGDKIIEIPYDGINTAHTTTLSPDGKYIMVSVNSGLQLIDLSSGDLSEIVSDNIADNNSPMWAPNGQSIVYESNSKIFIYDLLQDKFYPLVNGTNPVWSVDGSQIQYISEANIYTINLINSEITQIIEDMPFLDFERWESLAWSPNRDRVAFISNMEGYDAVYMMNVDGSELVRLTDESIANKAYSHSIYWSPNGSQILFPCRYSYGNSTDLCLANTDGSGQVVLTDTPLIHEYPVAWSPDSKQIIFTRRAEKSQRIHAYVFDIATTETQLFFGRERSSVKNVHWWSNVQ